MTVRSSTQRTPRRTWWIALAFVTVGFGYLLVAGIDSSVTVDDGFYQLPVESLRTDGSWAFDYVLADVDPDGRAAQWSVGSAENGFFTNVRRPLWVLGLVAADFVGGVAGQRLAILGAAAAAVLATSKLACTVLPARQAWVAGALTALSPIAFNALQFWAHAPTAAVTGFVTWSGVRVMDAGRRVPWPTLAVGMLGAAIAPAIRTDGTIYMAAVAAVVGLSGLRRRRLDVTVFGGVLGAVALTSHVVTAFAQTWITGGPRASSSSAPTARSLVTRGSSSLDGRVEGFLDTFVSGNWRDDLAYVLLLVSMLLVAYAVVLIRRRDPKPALVLLAVAGVAWLLRLSIFPGDFATGLLGAWPVALLVFAEPLAERSPAEKRIMAIVGIAFLGVAATQYDVGGGLNWGGRFLSAAIPALAVLVAATLHRLRRHPGFEALAPAVLGLAAVFTVASLAADWDTRTRHDDHVRALEDTDTELPVVTSSQALPNLAWRAHPDVRFVWVRDEEHARVVSELLADTGYHTFLGYLLEEDHAEVLTGRSVAGDIRQPETLRLRAR